MFSTKQFAFTLNEMKEPAEISILSFIFNECITTLTSKSQKFFQVENFTFQKQFG